MRGFSLAASRRFSSLSSSSLSSVVAGSRFFSSSSSSSSSISRRSESPNDENENADADAYDDARRRNRRTRLNYTNVLLVVKETALAKYTSLADSGNQPGYEYRDKNVRWDRLKVRHEAHEKAVLKGTLDAFSLSLDSRTGFVRLLACFSCTSLYLSSFVKGTLSVSLDVDAYSCIILFYPRVRVRYATIRFRVSFRLAVRTFLKEWERETGGRLRHSLVSRDSLSEKDVKGKDLVVALGGDGTTLIASHWISSSFSSSREGDENKDDGEDSSSFVRPKLIGINTDPAVLAPCLTFTKKAEDERRSTGWLCAADANDVEDVLREILFASSEASPLLPQDVSSDGKESSDSSNSSSSSSSSNRGSLKRRPIRANRIRVKVNGQTWKTMPLALNDVLICHNSPAALSRYSVLLEESDLVNNPPSALSDEKAPSSEVSKAYYHIRSSGLRLCTALGSTAAMKSAGGYAMSRNDQRIQFHDREPIYYDHEPKPPGRGRGFYDANKTTKFRWNTRVGKIFVDGAHVCHDIKIGDEIEVESAIGDEIEIYCKNFRNIALT